MISVILPVLNESTQVGQLVRAVQQHPQVDEVLVVDDGSIDSTPTVARQAGARVITSTFLGKGASLRDGLQLARNKILVFIDTHVRELAPETLTPLIEPLLQGSADLIKAKVPGGDKSVSLLNARPLLRLFFPELKHIAFPLAGLWAARRSLLQKMPFEMDHGVEIGILLDALAAEAVIQETDVGPVTVDEEEPDNLALAAQQVTRTILTRAARHNRLRAGYLADLQENDRQGQADLVHVLQQAEPADRIALFDMDGVLIRGNFVLELAHHINKGAELGEHLDNPDLQGDELLQKIASVFVGVPREEFSRVAHEMPLMAGARETVAALRRSGYLVGVMSESYHVAADIIRCRVFADFSIAHLMKFQRGKALGRLTFAPAMIAPEGSALQHGRQFIPHHLSQLTGIPAERMLVVGNHENDIALMKSVGLAIAFRPKKPGVRAATPHVVDSALTDVLHILAGEAAVPLLNH